MAQELRFPCLAMRKEGVGAAAAAGDRAGGSGELTAINCNKFCSINNKLHFRFGDAAMRAAPFCKAPPPRPLCPFKPAYILWSSVRKCFSFPFVFPLFFFFFCCYFCTFYGAQIKFALLLPVGQRPFGHKKSAGKFMHNTHTQAHICVGLPWHWLKALNWQIPFTNLANRCAQSALPADLTGLRREKISSQLPCGPVSP